MLPIATPRIRPFRPFQDFVMYSLVARLCNCDVQVYDGGTEVYPKKHLAGKEEAVNVHATKWYKVRHVACRLDTEDEGTVVDLINSE
jgi:hypothetical protein